MTDSRWLNEREAAAWQAVRDLGQPLWTVLGRDLQRESGLSMADYQVLVVLSEERDALLPYRELAAATGWEKSRLSHHLTRMERRGLVRREDHSGDGRCANVLLTEHGRQAITAAAPGHVASVRRHLIDHLSDAEVDTLIAVGQRVRARLDGLCEGADDCRDACDEGSSAAATREPAGAEPGR